MEITDRVAFNALQDAGHLPQEIQVWLRKRQQADLRDQFAMSALVMRFGAPGSHIGLDDMASKCYAMADAMLEARVK